MITFFKGNLCQIICTVVGVIVWISVGWQLVKAWYAHRPLSGVNTATATMACVAAALQMSATGIKLLIQH